jgi:alpha-1,3-glucosyltransferase
MNWLLRMYSVGTMYCFLIYLRSSHKREWLLDRFSVFYTVVAVPLIIYTSLVHGLLFKDRYEFIPLMFTSAYTALGVVGSWLGFLVVYFEI